MNLLISNLKELMNKTGYSIKNMYQNPDLNYFFACFDVIENHKSEISEITNINIENLSYSQYYWYVKLKNKYEEIYGFDAGIEQQQFKLLEALEQRFNHIHWDIIEKIDSNRL